MNRREFLLNAGAFTLSPWWFRSRGMAQSAAAAGQSSLYSEEMPDMLMMYLANKQNTIAAAWDKRRAVLKSAIEIEARNAYVRAKVIQMLGSFPDKNPLTPVITKTIEKDGYRIENVMFQSRPDFWVTGNLYIPTTGKGPFPGIISPCGHYPLARMVPQYQSAYISLVKSGFVVLGYDPIGQGERRQYWNPKTDVTEIGPSPTYEHSMPGQLMLLMGENLTQYLVWDGMRAIDYLLTRTEVDPKRIGCAGHSGGGSMTTFISVVDERIRCVAILEGGMVNRWPMKIAPWQPIGPSDVEQNLFPSAIYGVDEIDLHVALAPRPVLTGIEHYGPAFDHAAKKVQDRYRVLGAEEKFATVVSDDPHAWTPKLRLATTDWFCRQFYNRSGPSAEPALETVAPEDLYCTPDGSVRYSGKGETIFSLIQKRQATLPPQRSAPKTSAERVAYRDEICSKIRSLLHYRKPDHPLDVRTVVTTPREGYRIEKIQFLSEPGIYIPAWVFIPNGATGALRTILYINDEGMEADGMEDSGEEASGLTHGVLDTLARKGNLVIAADVRGIGETRPMHPTSNSCNEFGQLFDLETAMAYMSWFMDESLIGMRVQDVVRTVDYVNSRSDTDKNNLHVIGKGMGGLWCLYAAALDPRIRSLICVQSLVSYRSLTAGDRYLYGADVFVPDVLLNFDLPQVAAAISGRSLTLIQPQDAMKKMVSADAAEEEYSWTRMTYERTGKQKSFRIEAEGVDLDSPERYLRLIETAD